MMLDSGDGYLPNYILRDVLPNLPYRSGEGIHRALYDLARVLAPWRTPEEREAIVRSYAACVDRHVPESEIQGALRDGARRAWKPGSGGGDGYARPPGFTLEAFKAFIAQGPRVDARWLAERSTLSVERQTAFTFLQSISGEGERFLLFDDIRTQGLLWTHPGAQDGPPHSLHLNRLVCGCRLGVWFLCNPVDPMFRVNGAGKLSRRSTGNVTAWRFMLLESDRDDIAPDEWLTALVRLELPIVSIVETGDRLPHALIHVGAENKEQWDAKLDELRPDLIRVGADVASLTGVRLSRLPQCQRLGRLDADGVYQKFQDGPRMQRLLFLNPGGVPITTL